MCGKCNKKAAKAAAAKKKPVPVKTSTNNTPRTYTSGNRKFRVKVAR